MAAASEVLLPWLAKCCAAAAAAAAATASPLPPPLTQALSQPPLMALLREALLEGQRQQLQELGQTWHCLVQQPEGS